VCAVTYLKHPAFAASATSINGEIQAIGDKYIQKQMTVPVTLAHLLPAGIKGLFCAMMIMGLFAGDSGHMHSWGSIFVQDVILPLRKTPMTPRQHLWALRGAVLFVAAFAFAFSLLFQQTQYIQMWWNVTSAVFVGGAGAAIIGGLYWRRGTTAAAWAAQIAGSLCAAAGIVLTNGPFWRWLVGAAGGIRIRLPGEFWLNGTEMGFLAACLAFLTYAVVSLLTCRQPYDLDRMLHRGKYAVAGEDLAKAPVPPGERVKNILKFGPEFTWRDKLASAGIFWFAMFLLAVNLVVTFWNLVVTRWPITWWSHYWMVFSVALPFVVAVGTLVWFGIGGTRDILSFFAALRTMKRDATDDGHVKPSERVSGEPVGLDVAEASSETSAPPGGARKLPSAPAPL
jgi:SSS family solute:Na+ symporter